METIKLNVGGRRFEVSRALLLETQPNSNLADLILNNEKNEEDATDEIFIDRDGDIFQHVLQYLRNGRVSLPTGVTIDSFITEMEYFTLEFEMDNILLSAGSKRNVDVKEDKEVSSSKPSKVASPSAASAPKATFVFGASVPSTNPAGGFQFNTGSSAFTTKESEQASKRSGFQQITSTNASKGVNSGGFSFGFNGASTQTSTVISTEKKESEASTKNGTGLIFGKPMQESHSSLTFPSNSVTAPFVFGTTATFTSTTPFTSTKSSFSKDFDEKGTVKEDFDKNASIKEKIGPSSPFVFKGSDYEKNMSIKSKQSSQGTTAVADTAQRLFEKVGSSFPSSKDGSTSNEEEDKALIAFDSLDGSKTGKIKVSQLLFLFDDIGEDFHGDEYDTQSQILDPASSGFIERSTFLEWYRKLSLKRVSESKDTSENETEKDQDNKKDYKGSTCHSIPDKISSTDRDNTNRIPAKSNEEDNRSEEIVLLKKESEIAKVYQREGKYDEAVPIFRRCLLMSEAIHGPKHPDTLSFMSDLGLVLEKKEEYGKAEHIYTKCLSKREEHLGPDHRETLSSMSSLANLYRLQKKYDKAEKLYDLCLPKMKTILGPDHHCTCLTMCRLGALYFDKGEIAKAEEYFVECLVRSEETLGSDHADTLMIVNTLGNFYLRQSDMVKARPLLLTTFSKRITFLGSKHPDTMHTMSSLAWLHSLEDEYEMAESLFNDCLSMNRENYGPKHRITLTSLFDLAEFYDTQGEYDKSLRLFNECLSERRKILGPDHPQTLNCMCSLASSYKSQRKFESESSLLQQVLTGRQKTLGSDHPDSVYSMAQLGISLLKSGRGKIEKIEELLRDSLSKQKEILGPDHPDTLELMHCLGQAYYRQFYRKGYNVRNLHSMHKAKEIWEDCLSRRKKVLGPFHKSTLQTMDSLKQMKS